MLLHIHPFRRESPPPPHTPWHSLTPQTRLLCTILIVFAIALTPNGRWETWGIYGLAVVSLMLLTRVSLSLLLSRVTIEFAFVGFVLLGTLFNTKGQVVWTWGFLQVTDLALVVLGSVAIKVVLSLLMLNILILTTSISALFQALQVLRMPPLLVAIMASMYRYLQVLIQEFTNMRRAALSRNLMLTNASTRRVIGNMIGSLFIRTYERGERVYQAMLARGYQGLPPVGKVPPYKQRDFLTFILTGFIILSGQLLILLA